MAGWYNTQRSEIMSKLAEKSNRICFMAVVLTDIKEFPGESYGVTKHKISREKVVQVFFGAVAQQRPQQVAVTLICVVLTS